MGCAGYTEKRTHGGGRRVTRVEVGLHKYYKIIGVKL